MEMQWSLTSSESRVTKFKSFNVISKYLAQNLINNPLSDKIDQINKTNNNENEDNGPTEILQRNKER